jgi:hypothetical protein
MLSPCNVTSRNEYREQSKKLTQITQSSSFLSSRKFFDVGYIFTDPTAHWRPPHSSPEAPLSKKKGIESCRRDLEMSEQLYKSMMLNLQKTYLCSKVLPKHEPLLSWQPERTQVIHSRKSPRKLFKRKTSLIETCKTTRILQPEGRVLADNQIRFIDPEKKYQSSVPLAKKLSLSLKSEANGTSETREQLSLFARKPIKSQPESPRRKFWSKTYRPWSPERRSALADDLCENIGQLIELRP